jgi:hypothetical protein
MSKKRVEFSQKPSIADAESNIDEWVAGKTDKKLLGKQEGYKRTTIYMPENLHKKIKVVSAKNGTTMTNIIVRVLEEYAQSAS